jgi:hypothetical protein
MEGREHMIKQGMGGGNQERDDLIQQSRTRENGMEGREHMII